MRGKALVPAAVMVVILALAAGAQAGISLGSAQSSKRTAAHQGGEASFRLFLFNIHQEEDMDVYLGVQSDGGLDVEMDPDATIIPYSEPGTGADPEPGFAFISTSQGIVRAREVTVRIGVPLTAGPGEHEVAVFAATDRGGGSVGSAQVRRFFFTVDVEGVDLEEIPNEVGTGSGEEQNGPGPGDAGKDPGNEAPEKKPGGTIRSSGNPYDSITGDIVGTPMYGPYVLVLVLVLLAALWRMKRI